MVMDSVRPNPDDLLAKLQREEVSTNRGVLKIFFGYAAGVGKTFAMLEQAQRAKAAGRDVVVGYVEPHSRPETQALVAGLELIPPQHLDYRGVSLREFDVDAAIRRHADLVVVDELAHTNAEGSRHAKRWQDVEELLAAGSDVWTTLNVQHIDSLNDVIGQVTGVAVRETIPDGIFESASEIELVDLSPDDLLERLRLGKIYIPEQAQRALRSFFQKSNLNALRELSLRQVARRVHSEVESNRREKSISQPWATAERLLVCVGPSPTTAKVIRTAKRMAAALDAPWIAVSVEVAGESLRGAGKSQLAEHFRIAERLGGEVVTLSGQDVAGTILEFARSRNVTKILIGKTQRRSWRRLLRRTVVDDLLDGSGRIDIYVIHGEEVSARVVTSTAAPRSINWWAMGGATLWIIATSAVAGCLRALHLSDANTVMLFLATVAFVAYRWGRGPSILASILAVTVFDFFFVPPTLTMAVTDAQYIVTFAVMLAIGVVISTLTSRLKAQVVSTQLRERRTLALYELGKQLSSLYGGVFLISAAGRKIAELAGGEVAVYLRRPSSPPQVVYGEDSAIARHSISIPAAEWVMNNDQLAGPGTNTLPNATALFLPLVGSQQTLGAVAVRTSDMEGLLEPDQRRLLEACVSQLALALERDQLAIDAAEARIQAESEQVRSALLSSVSHDLRTPLATIAGVSSSLLAGDRLDVEVRRQLLETLADEANRLCRLLENILQMSRLDSGSIAPNKQWHVLEEIIGSALARGKSELANHRIAVHISEDMPLVFVDGLLVEQILVNLLENAARYTPAGTQICVSAVTESGRLRLTVADGGPGLPVGAEERIFDKFYRGMVTTSDAGRGSGLGLAICRAIATVHGGTITASNRPTGGAEFVLRIPLAPNPPRVEIS